METTFARMQDCKNARNDLKCIFSEFFTQIICYAHEILLPLHCQSEVVVTTGIKEKNCEH